jgi:hypothetical protein
MGFNILITFNDILFLIGLAPMYAVFWAMFMDVQKSNSKRR